MIKPVSIFIASVTIALFLNVLAKLGISNLLAGSDPGVISVAIQTMSLIASLVVFYFTFSFFNKRWTLVEADVQKVAGLHAILAFFIVFFPYGPIAAVIGGLIQYYIIAQLGRQATS